VLPLHTRKSYIARKTIKTIKNVHITLPTGKKGPKANIKNKATQFHKDE
jgi:hypothetical protein